MYLTLFTFLLFLIFTSISSVSAQVGSPLSSSHPQIPSVPVLILTTTTVDVINVTAVITEIDVIIATFEKLATSTEFSRAITTVFTDHVTSILSNLSQTSPPTEILTTDDTPNTIHSTLTSISSANSQASISLPTTINTVLQSPITTASLHATQSLLSIVLSTPIDTMDTIQPTPISSYMAQNSSSSSLINTLTPVASKDTAHDTPISSHSTPTSIRILPSKLSTSLDTDYTTQNVLTSSNPSQHSPSKSPNGSSTLMDTTKLAPTTSSSSSPVQSSPSSSLSHVPTPINPTATTPMHTTLLTSKSSENLPSSSSSDRHDTITIEWITRSMYLTPSTITTTITYPTDRLHVNPSVFGDFTASSSVTLATQAIQLPASSNTLHTPTNKIVSTIIDMHTIAPPTTTSHITTTSSHDWILITDFESLFRTMSIMNSESGSELSSVSSTDIKPTLIFVNESASLRDVSTNTQIRPSSLNPINNSYDPSIMGAAPTLPYSVLRNPLTHSLPRSSTSSLSWLSRNSSFLTTHTTSGLPSPDTRTPTSQTFDPSHSSNTSYIFHTADTARLVQTFDASQASQTLTSAQTTSITQTSNTQPNNSIGSNQKTSIAKLALEQATSTLESSSLYSMTSYSNATPLTTKITPIYPNSTKVQSLEEITNVGKRLHPSVIPYSMDNEKDGSVIKARDYEESSQAERSAVFKWQLALKVVPLSSLVLMWLI